MTDPQRPSDPATAAPAPTSWRVRVGITLFAIGLGCPLFIPVLALLDLPDAWMATLSGLFMLGLPEILWLAAAAFLGKEGFARLKTALWRLVKRHALPQTVGPVRHAIGLVLFVGPVLLGWLLPYVSELIPGYEENRTAVNVAGDIAFLASLVVLGGDFWDKLRSLFVREARAHFPPV